MSVNALGSIADPGLRDVLIALKNEISYSFNCHQVGQIASYDPLTQQATVQILMQRLVYNRPQTSSGSLQVTPTIYQYPVLVNCPVFNATGGGFVLTLPIAVGDPCLILFNDRDIDNWFETGLSGPPITSRAHDLSDGFVIVGFRNLTNSVSSYSTTAAELRSNDNTAKVSVAQALSELINNTEVKLAVGTTIVDLNSTQIGIANSTTSLKLVMDSLITALTGWVDTHGDTPNAATVTALTAAKTLSDALLK